MWLLKAYSVRWLLLAFSGFGLMLLYVPITKLAIQSAPTQHGITVGYVTRGVHFWMGQLAVLALLAYLARVLFAKQYKPLAAWKIGYPSGLAALTGLSWFTGMLLPWDSLPGWLKAHPWSGQSLTLTEIYWLHTTALFILTIPLISGYLRRIREKEAIVTESAPVSL